MKFFTILLLEVVLNFVLNRTVGIRLNVLKSIVPCKLWCHNARKMQEHVLVVEPQWLHRQGCEEFVRWQPLWTGSMHTTAMDWLEHTEIRSKNSAKYSPNHFDVLWNKYVRFFLISIKTQYLALQSCSNTKEKQFFLLPSNAFNFFNIKTNSSTTIFWIGKCLINTHIDI